MTADRYIPAPAIRRAVAVGRPLGVLAATARPPVGRHALYIRGPPHSLRALNGPPGSISRKLPKWLANARDAANRAHQIEDYYNETSSPD